MLKLCKFCINKFKNMHTVISISYVVLYINVKNVFIIKKLNLNANFCLS